MLRTATTDHGSLYDFIRKRKKLLERMEALGVLEKDVEEQFVRSFGAGGQKVNKVSTCVLLHHRPIGSGSSANKSAPRRSIGFLARRILLDKI